MRIFSSICAFIFMAAAMIALLVMHDPTFSIACCAMSGLCRLDAEMEEWRKNDKRL